jgi:Co/Zn/Cd efflux system component
MSAGHDHSHTFDGMNDAYKRRLMLVTAINVGMFFIEFSAGHLAGSQALQADALDFFADGVTYALSFWAIGRPQRVRTGAAVLKGISLLAMGIWIAATTL